MAVKRRKKKRAAARKPKKTARRKAAKKGRKKTAKRATKAKKAPKRKKRKANPAFMKALKPSAALAAIVGARPLSRPDVMKKLWAYIKKNKLQDAVNRRMINADAALKAVFGGQSKVDMFKMTALVSRHLT